MKKLLGISAALMGLLAMASPSKAQIITWGAAQDMTGNPDISTLGSYFDAASAYGTITVNNGVAGVGGTNTLFNALTGNPASDGAISVTIGDGQGAYGASFTTATPSSTSYSDLVNTGVFGAGGASTVTLTGLTVGSEYQIQSWSYYSGDSATATTDYSNGLLSSNPLYVSDAVSLLNQTGQFAIGTFTATSADESFDFSTTGGHQFINDVSVRDLTVAAPEPSTWAMMLGGLVMLGFCVRRKASLLK
jgi:hypothetical protein